LFFPFLFLFCFTLSLSLFCFSYPLPYLSFTLILYSFIRSTLSTDEATQKIRLVLGSLEVVEEDDLNLENLIKTMKEGKEEKKEEEEEDEGGEKQEEEELKGQREGSKKQEGDDKGGKKKMITYCYNILQIAKMTSNKVTIVGM
jgi:hypothetical protein